MGLPVRQVVEQHPHRLCPARRPEGDSIDGHRREIELHDRGTGLASGALFNRALARHRDDWRRQALDASRARRLHR
jgi:hypothetical protein